MNGDPELGEPQAPEAPEPEVFVRFGLLFYGTLAAAAVVWRIGFHGEPIWFTTAEAAGEGLHWARDIGMGLGSGAAILLLSHVMTRYTGWGERLARLMAESLGPLSTPNAVLLAFASGLAEELFFRGALQPRAGWIAASILFGALHFVPRREFLPWTVFAIASGLLFGWLFEMTGNLTAPVVAHTLVNGVNLPRLVREYGAPVSTPPPR